MDRTQFFPVKNATESILLLHVTAPGDCSRFWLSDLTSQEILGLKWQLRQAGKSQCLCLKKAKRGVFKQNFEFLRHTDPGHRVLLPSVIMSSWCL